MSNLLQTGAEFEKKLKERAESTEKMLNDEFTGFGFRRKEERNNPVSRTKIENAHPFSHCILSKSGNQYGIDSITKGFRILHNTVAFTL